MYFNYNYTINLDTYYHRTHFILDNVKSKPFKTISENIFGLWIGIDVMIEI